MDRRRALKAFAAAFALSLASAAPAAAQTTIRYAHVGSEGDIQ